MTKQITVTRENGYSGEIPDEFPPQKYKSTCDHQECQDSEHWRDAVTVYNFPPKGYFKFGDLVVTYCQKHFLEGLKDREIIEATLERKITRHAVNAAGFLLIAFFSLWFVALWVMDGR